MRFCKKIVFLFVVYAIAFMTFSLNVKAASQVTGFAYNITTQFGEDASTEANINFFSNTDKAYIEYTLATDTAFANKIVVEGDKKQLGDDFKEDFDGDNIQDTRYQTITDYNYEVYLKDLQPGTKYMYRVTDGAQYSDVFKFTTATGNSDSYTFVYINDPQLYSETGAKAYYECLDLAQAKANENGTPIQFVLGGGDMVESGGDAYYWNKLLSEELYKEVQYMAIPGNHEFTGLQSYLGKDGRFYCVSVNNPKNGCESYGEYQEVSCYYRYNDTLFIQLSSSGKERKDQVEWVDKVLAENTSQFVIVNIHYPVVSNATDNVNEFIPVFDKYGVDLVLYGHTHTFNIQENYYNWKATSETGKGTYYMSMASSERSGNEEAIYSLITVSKDFIQVKNYNRKGAQLKSFSVKTKRTSSFELGEFDKEAFKSSLSITSNFDDSSKATISWDKTGYSNVKYVNVKNEAGEVVSSNFIYCDAISTATLSGLEANKKYNYTIEVVYNDGTSEEVPYVLSTDVVYGVLENLVVDTTSTRFRLQYTPKFKSDVKSLKAYVNGKEVATATVKDRRILLSLSDFTEGIVNVVEIKGVLADGSEALIYSTTHGEDTSSALNAVKEAKKAEVEALVAELKEEEFSSEAWSAITAAKAETVSKIEAATSEEELAGLVEALSDKILEITMAELLGYMKDICIAALEEAFVSLNEEDFSSENWAALLALKEATLSKIAAATTEDELLVAVEEFTAEVEKIVKSEEANSTLNVAKEAKKAEVEALVAELKEEDFSSENWKAITAAKEEAVSKIEAATKEEELAGLVEALATVITEKVEAEKLAALNAAKEAAIASLNAIVDGLKESDYSEADWDSIVQTKEEMVEMVELATTESQLETAVNGLQVVIDGINAANAEALKAAIDAAKASVNTYLSSLKEADYSEENWGLINDKKAEALEKIGNAKSEAEAKELVDALKVAVEAIEKVQKQEEKKSGCGNAASLLFLSFMLLGLCIIRRKH